MQPCVIGRVHTFLRRMGARDLNAAGGPDVGEVGAAHLRISQHVGGNRLASLFQDNALVTSFERKAWLLGPGRHADKAPSTASVCKSCATIGTQVLRLLLHRPRYCIRPRTGGRGESLRNANRNQCAAKARLALRCMLLALRPRCASHCGDVRLVAYVGLRIAERPAGRARLTAPASHCTRPPRPPRRVAVEVTPLFSREHNHDQRPPDDFASWIPGWRRSRVCRTDDHSAARAGG